VAQVVEPIKCEALSSNSSTTKKKNTLTHGIEYYTPMKLYI
jgi:hypothetical protein